MGTRTVLSAMFLSVAMACISCASRHAGPASPAGPGTSQATEPQVLPPEASAALVLNDTVSEILGGVRVAHKVPDGWELDLTRADDGRISMHRPDGNASIGIIFAQANGYTPAHTMSVLYSHWTDRVREDGSIRLERPVCQQLDGGEICALVAYTSIESVPVTVSHIFVTANDPAYILSVIGAWPTEEDGTCMEMMGTIAGHAFILPRGD